VTNVGVLATIRLAFVSICQRRAGSRHGQPARGHIFWREWPEVYAGGRVTVSRPSFWSVRSSLTCRAAVASSAVLFRKSLAWQTFL